MDRRWLALQGSVAAGMVVVLLVPMVFVARAFIPPLAVAAVLFAVALAVMPARPRASAVAVGAISAVWLLLQLVNLSRVIPDLLRPQATSSFIVTLAMLVLPAAGVTGLVGALRHARGEVATRVVQGGAALLAVGVLGAAGVRLVVGDPTGAESETTVAGGPVVTLADNSFQPARLTVTPGTEVTWVWRDGSAAHNVVAEQFESRIRASGVFTHRFDDRGTYAYECTLHPGMAGTVEVTR